MVITFIKLDSISLLSPVVASIIGIKTTDKDLTLKKSE